MTAGAWLRPIVGISVLAFLPSSEPCAADAVDFRYSPPEWQTAICLPDDPCKTLVDRSGELLYRYGQGGREFGTRISVEVASNAVWQRQELLSPRVPIVRTFRLAEGLEIVEEAFAVTDLPAVGEALLRRTDGGQVNRNWAKPEGGVVATLRDIAVHNDGSIRFEATGQAQRIALALCEGWWGEEGKRVEVLRVEGDGNRTVDTVRDIGKNKAAAFWFDGRDVDGDGRISISVDAAEGAADKNTILNDLWVFPADMPADDRALLTGKLDARAVARLDLEATGGPPRNDLILVHVTNMGSEQRTLQPKIVVDTAMGFQFIGEERREDAPFPETGSPATQGRRGPARNCVIVNGRETITCSLKMTGPVGEEGTRRVVPLEALTVPGGKKGTFFVLYSGGGTIVTQPATLKEAMTARERAVAYWEKAALPYGRIEVPDAGVQSLVDSSIRNIWQAREIKNGLTVFQVGPTCYRGLWIVDGAFLLEAATILGAGDQARNGVAYELTHQKPDGRIEVMQNYSKENGIVLWTCVRHAQLTQDKAWLESVWPKLERIAGRIKQLRLETLGNDSPSDDGLVPPGFPDGGIGGVQYEYTNPYWNLLGLRSFIQAAHWMGKNAQAASWQKEYDDFMAAFRKAVARDLKTDPQGHRYLPIRMDGQDLPQRGQWGFCHAVYPGQLFAQDDPLVAGNMAMLEATEREGMVYGTGWDATGIWNYFASFYGHAWLWQGKGRKAADALYAFANHAAPMLVWREEQSLKGEPYKKVGDMPHNWASAEFIRLAVHLLAIDRGDELHLFEGLPAEWTRPGMVTKLDGIATPFGKLSMELKVAADGRTAALRVEPLSDTSCSKMVAHMDGWAGRERGAALELDPRKLHRETIPLNRSTN
jgi:hypothetical protein